MLQGKPIKTERQISSGGVVFRRTEGLIEVALIQVEGRGARAAPLGVGSTNQRGSGRVWCLPKGLKEKGENLARTAHREVKEETGLDGRIVKKINDIHYFYTQKDEEGIKRFFKIVYFFLMEYTAGETVYHDKEVLDCKWFSIDEAMKVIAYKDEKEIVRRAKELIEKESGGLR